MGQKSDDCKTTLSEAFIQFQIQVKKKEIQEFKNETSLLEAKNQRLIELRDQLREEQLGHIRTLRKQAKEQERKLNESEQANKEQVEHALQHDIELSRRQEEELAELHQQLTGLETQVMELRAQQQVLLEYKSIGRALHQRQIQDLQSELSTMQQDFQEMSENIQYSRDATFNEIDKKKSQMINEEKQLATERVIKQLDKPSRHEIIENDWLKREIAIYHKEVSVLEAAVRTLEEKNLKHMNQLFEQHLSDLQISRNMFLTHAAGLRQPALGNTEQLMEIHTITVESGSVLHPAPGSGAEGVGEQRRQARVLEQAEPVAPCDPAMHPAGSQSDLRELLHLGPLEQKLLTVMGQAMTLHPMPSDSEGSGTSTHLDFLETPDWSLTTSIIRNQFP